MNNLYNYFEKMYNENKLGHSFLIGNVFYEDIKSELNSIINNFFYNNNVDINNSSDIYIYDQNEKNLTKEDIKQLLKNLTITSQFSNPKIYIIDKCETLNDSVYNSMLKTLEEPENQIYAFLITNNIDSIIPTVSSRCQKIFINKEKKYNLSNISQISIDFINTIEKNGLLTISKFPEIYNDFSDRKVFINILSDALIIYRKVLDGIIISDKIEFDNVIQNNTIESLAKKIILTEKTLKMLKTAALNKNLIIDRYIIEMWRCGNE